MQIYSIKKESQGILVYPNGDFVPFTTRQDHEFFSEDIIMDPIRLHNHTISNYRTDTNELQHTAEQLAKLGYTVFKKPGRYTGFAWGLAIKDEIDTEMT